MGTGVFSLFPVKMYCTWLCKERDGRFFFSRFFDFFFRDTNSQHNLYPQP